ncbi:unnamed protein product [Xylocopa violacea]|uniref:Uncharacterized protein n=1 Tax=Xylocopa violacea TaxID=135666 RepID=A0ABP1N144_XYLVO
MRLADKSKVEGFYDYFCKSSFALENLVEEMPHVCRKILQEMTLIRSKGKSFEFRRINEDTGRTGFASGGKALEPRELRVVNRLSLDLQSRQAYKLRKTVSKMRSSSNWCTIDWLGPIFNRVCTLDFGFTGGLHSTDVTMNLLLTCFHCRRVKFYWLASIDGGKYKGSGTSTASMDCTSLLSTILSN